MPEIRPFRGVRYDMAKVGTLTDVVAPPYDVIDSALQDKLYDLSPYNVIRMEYNRPEPTDAPGSDRYTAAGFLKDWQKTGVLRTDDQPALYVYDQTFTVEGQTHTRRGFLARVRLEPFGDGRIYPHEQTLSGPKADRLALYHATNFNLSPIFGLYPDPENAVQAAVEIGIKDRTPLEAVDHLGVKHRLWPVTDPVVHTAVQGLMTDRSIFIADGHHRYETGLRYRQDQTDAGQLAGPDDPANFCMMQLVGMSDPGLLILPTHRLVSGLAGLTGPELIELLAPEFDMEGQGHGPEAAKKAWEEVQLYGDQDMLAFGTVTDDHWITARLRSDTTMDQLVPEHSAEWRSLGVSILHKLVLEHLLKSRGTAQCRYVHLLDEVLTDVAAKGCDLACLVPPAEMDHVQDIASNLEKMPPKSTYFYPKLLTGMAFNPLT
jgi:uncharacterized protein (DUF1015 family)